VLEDHATSGVEGEKLHGSSIRERDRSQIEAHPSSGLERLVEQPFQHHEVLLGDVPCQAKKDLGGSLDSSFDSQHGQGKINKRANESSTHLGGLAC
jgi:hypothetical protein